MDQLQGALLRRTPSNDDGAEDTSLKTWNVQEIVNDRRNTVHPCCHTLNKDLVEE